MFGVNDFVVEWNCFAGVIGITDLDCCIANPCLHTAIGNEEPIDISSLPVALTDIPEISSDTYTNCTRGLRDNYGNTYNKAERPMGTGHTLEYLLTAEFSRIRGTLYIPKGTSSAGDFYMNIIADGTTIFESGTMTKESVPINFDVDISGCNSLKLDFSKGWSSCPLCIADVYLYGSQSVQYDPSSVSLGYNLDREAEFSWGWELFNRNAASANSYDRNLALAAAYLCEGTYNGQGDAERRMRALGFAETQSEYYEADIQTNTSPITVSSTIAKINGKDTLIVAVAVRGTKDLGDFLTDIRSGLFNVDGFSEAGETAMSVVSSYCTSIQQKHNIDAKHTVLFVSGHSLGAAIAGQIAGNLENTIAPRESIIAYTFASPYYETHGKPIGDYTNIHNIINTEDAVPKFPIGGKRYGIDYYFTGAGNSMLEQHMLYVYFDGLKNGLV